MLKPSARERSPRPPNGPLPQITSGVAGNVEWSLQASRMSGPQRSLSGPQQLRAKQPLFAPSRALLQDRQHRLCRAHRRGAADIP